MRSKYTKNCSASLIPQEMQIRTVRRYRRPSQCQPLGAPTLSPHLLPSVSRHGGRKEPETEQGCRRGCGMASCPPGSKGARHPGFIDHPQSGSVGDGQGCFRDSHSACVAQKAQSTSAKPREGGDECLVRPAALTWPCEPLSSHRPRLRRGGLPGTIMTCSEGSTRLGGCPYLV